MIWLTGGGYDVVFDLSRGVVVRAGIPARQLAHEMVGWPYHHDLDLTGFIDDVRRTTNTRGGDVDRGDPAPLTR